MDTSFLAGKYLLFVAMELIVAAVVVAALLAGVYQIVRDKVRRARQADAVAPRARVQAARPAQPGASPVRR